MHPKRWSCGPLLKKCAGLCSQQIEQLCFNAYVQHDAGASSLALTEKKKQKTVVDVCSGM